MPRSRHGFTLIELVVVMVLLTTILGIAGPRLSRFIGGRSVNEEARRFAALTRLARSEAISRGERMQLWIDPLERTYGLRPDDPSAREEYREMKYELAADLNFAVGETVDEQAARTELAIDRASDQEADPDAFIDAEGVWTMLFWPDGTIDETSPARLLLTEKEQPVRAIALAENRLQYAVEQPTDEERADAPAS